MSTWGLKDDLIDSFFLWMILDCPSLFSEKKSFLISQTHCWLDKMKAQKGRSPRQIKEERMKMETSAAVALVVALSDDDDDDEYGDEDNLSNRWWSSLSLRRSCCLAWHSSTCCERPCSRGMSPTRWAYEGREMYFFLSFFFIFSRGIRSRRSHLDRGHLELLQLLLADARLFQDLVHSLLRQFSSL